MMMRGIGFQFFVAVLVLAAGFHQPAAAKVWFTSPELRVAADDLVAFLNDRGEEGGEATLATTESVFQPGSWVLANHTKNRANQVSEALNPEQEGYLETSGQESFVAVSVGGIAYLVGGGHRGATYASVRIQDHWRETGSNPLREEMAILGRPLFRDRIAGSGGPNPELDFAQPIPRDYEWETFAAALAHAGINTTPGIVQGKTIPDEALKPWGIRKILYASAVPFSESELRKWRTSNPGEIVASDNPRDHQSSSVGWSVCPNTDFGKQVYSDWLDSYLADNKSASHLVFFFADWGSVPGEECSQGADRVQRIVEFLRVVSDIALQKTQDLRVLACTRGLSAEEISGVVDALPARVGLYFEEPVYSLLDNPQTGYDPMACSVELAPEYEKVLDRVLSERGNESVYAIAAGDSDWLMSPAIGVLPPLTTFLKTKVATQKGAQNIAFAMGGFHPWNYSPAVEVFNEMIWDPTASYEDLAKKVAERDFGPAADEMLGAWSMFAQAMNHYPAITHAQTLEEFIGLGDGLVTRAPRPAALASDPWAQEIGEAVPYLLESLPAVLGFWRQGITQIQAAQDTVQETSYDIAKRIRDGWFNAYLYYRLLETQHNVIRCLNVLRWVPEGAETDRNPWQVAFFPAYRDEIENSQGWQDLLFASPLEEIRVDGRETTPGAVSRRFEQKASALSSMAGE
jgi:hypothetical protein